MCDPRLPRMLAFEQMDDAPAFITYALRTHVLEDGWALGERPGWGTGAPARLGPPNGAVS
jgi:hypothetical protein